MPVPVSLAALIVAEACNVGLVPIEKPNVPALTRARLLQVDQGHLRGETIAAANARPISAQTELDIVRCRAGGHIASADGLRFVVPVTASPVAWGGVDVMAYLLICRDRRAPSCRECDMDA
ncbi:Tn3 family transposase [Streptosporangium roseum]|uniref:Tn3 family transposase n=2 Tax=Streptosporangium roseum TaxID=2001 RepID=UPI00146D6459|nr:Tn3 family transposase [Streptosporangium roseum]